jgi:hypothetical protein
VKLTVESTTRIISINGVPARVWEGTSEAGVPVYLAVTRVSVPEGADQSEFAKELQAHKPPSDAAVLCFPLRMVI